MKIKETGHELIISEAPVILWSLGLFFAAIGAAFVYGSLGGYSNFNEAALWVLVVHFTGGCLAVATGLWLIFLAPVTKVVIDRDTKSVTHLRRGLFGKQENIYSFEQIKQFCTIEEKDTDGDPIWSLGIRLTDGETVKISSLPANDEKVKLDFVFRSNQFMYKQIPSFRDEDS